jgi:cytochrome c-type biogenesis protein
VLTAVVIFAALAAGVTGAWSPCGFSMVETLAPSGYAGRVRTSLVACATFAVGALAGGVITFGGLSLLGHALGAGGPGALAVAAAIALAAATGEARGARILPQVRRQVPEAWRRRLPVPLAAGLYGVLLGLGFTTFILTFAVWALAGVCVAVGDPALGIAVGFAFGAGRLLPVVLLAPTVGTRRGAALHAAMAERPQILRSLRAVDALALAACAVVLVT